MANQWPALIVTSGSRQAGECFTVRPGEVTLGRGNEAGIRLEGSRVSRRHAQISRQDLRVHVCDLGSSNGSYLNGSRLTGTRLLQPGDRLTLGDVELEYLVVGAPQHVHPQPSRSSYDVGDVHGPVNAGAPVNHSGSQLVGSGSIYHGNVHHGDQVDVEADLGQGLEELFSGRGPGRVLMALGLVLVVVGFGIWMSVIFSGITGSGDPFDGSTPFDRTIFGLNAAVTGFASFATGGLLFALGDGMSKAARKRDRVRSR